MHVASILLFKGFLIYFNLDPSKFSKATNSSILNNGLWIQTEVSLVISILYMLIGIRKNSQMKKLIQNFHDIDQEFSKSFYMKYYYVHAQQYVTFKTFHFRNINIFEIAYLFQLDLSVCRLWRCNSFYSDFYHDILYLELTVRALA